MKKKIIIAIVAVVVVAAIGVGAYFLIGGAGAPKMEFADTPDVLNKVISTYAEDKTFFAMGVDGSTEVEEGKAGLVNLADKENANFVLHTTDAVVLRLWEEMQDILLLMLQLQQVRKHSLFLKNGLNFPISATG